MKLIYDKGLVVGVQHKDGTIEKFEPLSDKVVANVVQVGCEKLLEVGGK